MLLEQREVPMVGLEYKRFSLFIVKGIKVVNDARELIGSFGELLLEVRSRGVKAGLDRKVQELVDTFPVIHFTVAQGPTLNKQLTDTQHILQCTLPKQTFH